MPAFLFCTSFYTSAMKLCCTFTSRSQPPTDPPIICTVKRSRVENKIRTCRRRRSANYKHDKSSHFLATNNFLLLICRLSLLLVGAKYSAPLVLFLLRAAVKHTLYGGQTQRNFMSCRQLSVNAQRTR